MAKKPTGDRKPKGSKPQTDNWTKIPGDTPIEQVIAQMAPEAAPKDQAEAQAAVEDVIKRYRGRPTKYDPGYCDAVIAWGTLGKSKAWMCGEMMIARTTMDAWIDENDDFRYAMDTALHLSQQWWEDKGQDNLATTGFQGAMYSRSMAARFPADWREKLALTDPDGGKLVVEIVRFGNGADSASR